MPSLSRDLRRLLEKTIAGENGARQIAEAGAAQSLERLAVDRHEPHGSLRPDERTLRNQLRAHGRQLGDRRDPQRGTQTITHLKQAVAYEHWHRLLFARFLAENDLLLHPEHGIAISLDEVKEIALGLNRDWIEVAEGYAQRMLLREVFRPDDPALRVPLPPEKRFDLEGKLTSLPAEVFLADDSLGWVYQFWQTDAKAKVDDELRLGQNVDADRLPSKTQLFTEDYMVLFLLENTLGAWWASRHASGELPGYRWTYLHLGENGKPAAGSFEGWPNRVRDLRILDPCMGSGHFLTFALPILTRMRQAEEGLTLPDAITAVLRENLFGLELDPRCSQIAAFNLALTAWKLGGRHFELPPLALACSGLGINAKEEDWVSLAGTDGRKQDLLRWLYSLFRNAPTLGSLIDPRRVGTPMVEDEISELLPLLISALEADQCSDEKRELAIAAQGLIESARILSLKFTLIATNVPYLGRGKQDETLKDYCETFHRDARADLATCFVDRAMRLCSPCGSVALVTPQNWLFQTYYKDLRPRLLRNESWSFVARLGEHAFESSAAAGAFAALLCISRCPPSRDHTLIGWDVSSGDSPARKAMLLNAPQVVARQASQLANPSCVITLAEIDSSSLLGNYADCYQGISTGDTERLVIGFWEHQIDNRWRPFQCPPERTELFGGRSSLVDWATLEAGFESAAIRGYEAWNHSGVAIGQMRALPATLYSGSLFSNSTPVIVPKDVSHLTAIWAFCSSPSFNEALRKQNPKISVDNGYVGKIPFDLAAWQALAEERYPAGLPAPDTSSPTQWLFSGKPVESNHPLQVAVARLVGYEWPRQKGCAFPGCPALVQDELATHADRDGIVCLASLAGAESAGTRFRALLQSAYGADYNVGRLLEGKNSTTLDGWMRDEFFAEHCGLFRNRNKEARPFVWHIWDGLHEGFHAFVNYHKLDRKNLERLIYSYLGDWLILQRQDVTNGVEGADTRLPAAEHLQRELKKILDGDPPYDIFVRWKPLKEQPIGWEPDLNDGVRVNIRPWLTAATLYNATKPGILRVTPNIKHTKDRGTERVGDPKEFPWFKGSTDRINDHHLSLEEKRLARGL